MKFETSSLYKEVNNIIANGKSMSHCRYECYIKTKDKNIKVTKVLNVDIFRDFRQNFCDEIMLSVILPAGVYENEILPFKDNLDVKVFRTDYSMDPNVQNTSVPVVRLEGRGVLASPANDFFSNQTSATSKESKDLTSLKKLSIQILDPLIEITRLQSVGGIFRGTTGMDLLKTVFMNISSMAKVSNEYKIKGVDVVDGFNKNVKKHINIPSATQLIDMPDYINENVEGIYPTGLGFYLFKSLWYFYPLYDVERFDKSKRTLTIIKVPKDFLPHSEKTFVVGKNNVTIMSNKGMKLEDKSQHEQMNKGNGVRFVDASQLISGFVEVTGNKAIADRSKIVNEFVSEKVKSGLNNVVAAATTITSNAFFEMSRLAKRAGAILQVDWDFSDSDLIHPGMPVRIQYLQGNNIGTLYGCVLGVQTTIALVGQGMTSNNFKEITHLSIFIKRPSDWNPETIA